MSDKNTFWGCIYDAPVPDGQQPRPVDLTVREIQAMKFVGLPVRIEHEQGDVGKVIDSRTDPITGRTEVCFELDTTPAGIAARMMIQEQAIQQLSLKHLVYPERVMVPEEVSLCVKGAREKTDVYRTKNYKGTLSAHNSIPVAVVCMSAACTPENRIYMADQQYQQFQQAPPPAPVAYQQPPAQQYQQAPPVQQPPAQAPIATYQQQPPAQAPVATYQQQPPAQAPVATYQQQPPAQAPVATYQQQPPAQAPTTTNYMNAPEQAQPPAPQQAPVAPLVQQAPASDGQARDAQGRFAGKRSFEEVVNETVNKMNLESNPEAKRLFLDFAVQNAKSEFELANKVKQLSEENAKLMKQRSEDLKQTEGMAEQIAATIAKLYKQYAPTHKMADDDFSKAKKAMQESPDITRMLAPMVVACSNIFEANLHTQQHAMGKEIDTLQKQLSFYSQSFEHMQSPVQPPIVQQAPVVQQQQYAPPPPVWQPVVQQQPAVQPIPVAASVHTLREPVDEIGSVVNRMKNGHGSYNSNTVVHNRMPADMLPKGFVHRNA